jgi:alpha-D-ribose 1-methylphosphonate 5-triphosphate synthase subunit PhnH
MLAPEPAFANPVHDAQRVFRSLMAAMARPGTVLRCAWPARDVGAMPAGLVSVALAMCDFDTRVWLDGPLSKDPGVRSFISFHTGARITEHCEETTFAFVSDGEALPRLDRFPPGTPDYPDRSATLVVAVSEIREDGEWLLGGPGVRPGTRLHARPLPAGFLAWRATDHAAFPLGVDLVLIAGDSIVALPRSTAIQAA